MKGNTIMGNKNEVSIEELEEQYERLSKKAEAARKQLDKKKAEEESKKREVFAAEKEKRKAEIDAVYAHYRELLKKYLEDYGYYSSTYSADDDETWGDVVKRVFGSKMFDFFI